MRISPAILLVCFALAAAVLCIPPAVHGETEAGQNPGTAAPSQNAHHLENSYHTLPLSAGATPTAQSGKTIKRKQTRKSKSPVPVEDGWIRMRIDLIEIARNAKVKILNTRFIDGIQGQWSEHHLHFKSSLSAKQLSARFRVLATVLGSRGIQLDLGFRLVPQMENFQNAMVVARSRESAVLEFLENQRTGTRIAFRVTPIEVGRVVSPSANRSHHPIKEDVMVRWWVVPAFAVDSKNRPVTNLKKDDLNLYLNKKIVPRFHVYKKEYDISRSSNVRRFRPNRRVVFFVFDNFFTSHILVTRAKAIARSLVSRSENDNHYVLMSLEYGSGLKYIAGPTNDKTAVLKAIKDMKPTYMSFLRTRSGNSGIKAQESKWDKPFNPWQDVVDQSNKSNYRQDYKKRERDRREGDPTSAAMESERDWQDESEEELSKQPMDFGREKFVVQAFLRGLRTLDTAMGSLEDSSRVVYVFSSGIADKNLLRRMNANISVDTFHYNQLKRVGEVFNRNGVMLFVVNPEGHRISATDPESGEHALRVLANASGGRYYEGEKDMISKHVINMDRAFYEIAFPDTSTDKKQSKIKNFRIKVKRPGVNVYSVRKVTHGRDYNQLKSHEKEILVLNALEGGYLAKIKLKTKVFPLRLQRKSGNTLTYRIDLPKQLRQTECDVYKVWLNHKNKDAIMMMEAVLTAGEYLDISVKKRDKYAHYIVIVHPRTRSAFIGR